jgi:hypothetical protein
LDHIWIFFLTQNNYVACLYFILAFLLQNLYLHLEMCLNYNILVTKDKIHGTCQMLRQYFTLWVAFLMNGMWVKVVCAISELMFLEGFSLFPGSIVVMTAYDALKPQN